MCLRVARARRLGGEGLEGVGGGRREETRTPCRPGSGAEPTQNSAQRKTMYNAVRTTRTMPCAQHIMVRTTHRPSVKPRAIPCAQHAEWYTVHIIMRHNMAWDSPSRGRGGSRRRGGGSAQTQPAYNTIYDGPACKASWGVAGDDTIYARTACKAACQAAWGAAGAPRGRGS
jgi:hypothetical protein